MYGGKELAILKLTNEIEIELVSRVTINDWINAVRIYDPINDDEDQNQVRFCVLTSHSIALELEANANGNWTIGNKSGCIDKCTLYCSLVVGKKWSTTTILGGTALGELIIWSVKHNCMAQEVIHRLSGHNVSNKKRIQLLDSANNSFYFFCRV